MREVGKGCTKKEKSNIGLWVQTWSNQENITMISTYFITLQNTQLLSI